MVKTMVSGFDFPQQTNPLIYCMFFILKVTAIEYLTLLSPV